jgi:hypothetical protein
MSFLYLVICLELCAQETKIGQLKTTLVTLASLCEHIWVCLRNVEDKVTKELE